MSNRSLSPLRYPGGKSKLAPFIAHTLCLNGLENPVYTEPFAGGAGIALKLLEEGKVESIILNDFDPGIYSFWHSVFFDTERLIEAISKTKISLKERERQKKILFKSGNTTKYSFELGFAAFFLNRVNVSGIIKGGAIGGIKQTGKFKVDCRFGKPALIAKILKLSEFKNRVQLFNLDANKFIEELAKGAYGRKDNLFVFLDPPYYKQGKNLYCSFFNEDDHLKFASAVRKELNDLHWILTYDNEPTIFELYKDFDPKNFNIHYSANAKMTATELMFHSSKTKIESFDNLILH